LWVPATKKKASDAMALAGFFMRENVDFPAFLPVPPNVSNFNPLSFGVVAWWLVYGTWMAHDECGAVPQPFTLGGMVSGLGLPMELLVSSGVL
jgi:hypothetical protein